MSSLVVSETPPIENCSSVGVGKAQRRLTSEISFDGTKLAALKAINASRNQDWHNRRRDCGRAADCSHRHAFRWHVAVQAIADRLSGNAPGESRQFNHRRKRA